MGGEHSASSRPLPAPHSEGESPLHCASQNSAAFSAEEPQTCSSPRLRQARKSIFKELDTGPPFDNDQYQARVSTFNDTRSRPEESTRSPSELSDSSLDGSDDNAKMAKPPIRPQAFVHPRLLMLAITLLITVSLLYDTPIFAKAGPSILGAKAGVIRRAEIQKKAFVDGKLVAPRQSTSTDVCNRWSQQSAMVNGTIYLYGGHATTQAGQQANTWTNDFLTLDVTKSWGISAPAFNGLPQPSGPPAVSNGYLWNSYDSLFLYGGEFSDTPVVQPVPFALWEYSIKSKSWTAHQNPQTSAGNNSAPANQPVQRVAEGAGVSVSELGRGWYFAGHEDFLTTPGWSIQTNRTYLKSMIEFTFPGYTNDGIQSLAGGKTAGSDGVWRNITQGGIQDTALFPNRADSVLVYVPGYGINGILVSIGGGTTAPFTQMNVIDIYDIATSTWYRQATQGNYPNPRVNPCAVAASAPDGSSTNIYMYGGQNLTPYKNQTQYGDMWILTIPSFTWIEVDTTGQSVPPARVGHTCNIWDGQIVVVGGYNTSLAGGCDSGVYVFSATNLTWQNNFNSLSGGNGGNMQNQQVAQASDPVALGGSFGYQVPGAVQSVIGGKGTGGATITAPAQSATAGPLATGKPITYTVTGANGAVVTETGTAGAGASNVNTSQGPNVGAIVAGVVAGCFAILAGYLGFCAWVYRRQLALYKNHVAMTQRAAAAGPSEKAAFLGASSTEGGSSTAGRTKYSTDRSSRQAGSSGPDSIGHEPVPPLPPGLGAPGAGRDSTANSSTEDLAGEPSFVGVLLNPRRSLRVINRD